MPEPRIIDTSKPKPDKSEAIAKARTARAATKPIKSTAIERAGLGKLRKDGRRSGGTFALRRLVIARADNIGEDEKIIERAKARELCVPLNMDPQSYPTIQPDEAVMEEFEDEYESEQIRDNVLAMQVDPHWFPGRKNDRGRDWPANLGFAIFSDPMPQNADPNAGKAPWLSPGSPLVGANS